MSGCYICKKRDVVLYWPEAYNPEGGEADANSICSDCGGKESYD
tara:strand:- start:1519 stop:1650 length:132 start_codon:yes stop_codon:yes gene_type:complete